MIAAYIIVLAALLLFPQVCAQSAREALIVWGLHVTPSLFPYMVFSKMLAHRIRDTRFPQAAACAILGTIGGSPSGAAMIAESAMGLSAKAALSLCAFTGTISPMFFYGTIRSWTEDSLLSGQLYLAHLSGAAFTAVFVWLFWAGSISLDFQDSRAGKNGSSPLSQSIEAILQVGGCIICFSVLASLLGLLPFARTITPVLHALCEISGGVHAILQSPLSADIRKVLLAAVSGFAGFSVLSQNLFFLKPLGIRANVLFSIALVRSVFSALVMLVLIAF